MVCWGRALARKPCVSVCVGGGLSSLQLAERASCQFPRCVWQHGGLLAAQATAWSGFGAAQLFAKRAKGELPISQVRAVVHFAVRWLFRWLLGLGFRAADISKYVYKLHSTFAATATAFCSPSRTVRCEPPTPPARLSSRPSWQSSRNRWRAPPPSSCLPTPPGTPRSLWFRAPAAPRRLAAAGAG